MLHSNTRNWIKIVGVEIRGVGNSSSEIGTDIFVVSLKKGLVEVVGETDISHDKLHRIFKRLTNLPLPQARKEENKIKN